MMHHPVPTPPLTTDAPTTTLLLISGEFRLHREMLAGVLGTLRPQIPLHVVAATDTDAAVDRLRPGLVICDVLSPTIRALAPAWIVIPADPTHPSRTGGRGRVPRIIPHPPVPALVALVDALWNPTQAGSVPS